MPTPTQDENPNIQIEITDPHEFHCFRLVLNPQGAPEDPAPRIEIMLHARSLVDLIHKCSLALCDWQAQTSAELLKRLAGGPPLVERDSKPLLDRRTIERDLKTLLDRGEL